MKPIKIGLAFLALAAMAALAWGQGISPSSLTGQESWVCSIGGPQGTSEFCTANLMRNTAGYQLFGSASGTNNFTNLVNTAAVNAQPSASTVFTTPTLPLDGEFFQVCNVTAAAWATNTVNLNASTGSSINGGNLTLTTLAAHTCAELMYVASSTTWYQIR